MHLMYGMHVHLHHKQIQIEFVHEIKIENNHAKNKNPNNFNLTDKRRSPGGTKQKQTQTPCSIW